MLGRKLGGARHLYLIRKQAGASPQPTNDDTLFVLSKKNSQRRLPVKADVF